MSQKETGARFRLAPDVIGDAAFSNEDKHRLWLERRLVGTGEDEPFALFIGMNPSIAGAYHDDPTVRREWLMTLRRFKLRRYVKVNVMTLIATSPLDLLDRKPWDLADVGNVSRVRDFSEGARVTVACWGCLPPSLRRHSEAIERALTSLDDKSRLVCLGRTADGSPRHGRGLAKAAPLCTFP